MKNWEYSEMVHQLFVDLKKACDSVRRKVLCYILIEFGNPMKLPPINPTPHPYFGVSWTRTLLYPGSRGRR